MGGESSQAAPAASSSILSDDRIYICPDQFDDKAKELLTVSAKALGAAVMASPDDSTIILTNPAASAYQADVAAFGDQKGAAAKILPYHWLANCRIHNSRLSLDALPSPMPLFTNPVPEKAHAPVKTWVSINVIKRSNELPAIAQKNVSDDMEANGALLVSKRSQADVLIVDRTTKFYATIREEIRVRGRTGQIVAERDWVDDCVRRRQLSWKVDDSKATQATEEDGGKDSDQDSFVAEEPRPPGKGPGRPTGQPRVDYSPEDDDFLCRYLAQMGSNSFMSRKTYANLVSEADRYPIAKRHSAQSWHERYKKNSNGFSGRVQRFRQAGIDETLKTADERAKSAANARTPTRPAAVETPVASSSSKPAVAARRPEGSGSKSRLDARSAPTPKAVADSATEAVAAASTSGGNLVEPDTESDPSQNTANAAVPTVTGAEPARIPTEPAPAAVDIVMEETVIVETAIPPESANNVLDQSFDDRMAIDDVLGESVPQSQLQESGSRNESNGHGEVGLLETQALLSDFVRAKAAARAAHSTPPPTGSPRLSRREGDSAAVRSPRRTGAPASPYSPKPLRSPHRPSTALRPAAETFLLRSPDRGGHRTSMPAVVHVELQAVEIGGNLIDIQSPPGAGTPKRKSLLQRELETSSARRAARPSRPRESSPDRVYASTRLPPARASPYLAAPSSSLPASPRRRARSPPVSRVEQERRLTQGAQVAEAYRNEYKTNILRLGRTYNLLPKELGMLMADFRKRGVTGWIGIEEELAKMRREVESEFGDDV